MDYDIEINEDFLNQIGADAAWRPANKTMIIQSNLSSSDAVHESVHAFHQLTNTGVTGNFRVDEGMAYGLDNMIKIVDGIIGFENKLIGGGRIFGLSGFME